MAEAMENIHFRARDNARTPMQVRLRLPIGLLVEITAELITQTV